MQWFRRALNKPPEVILFRALQELRLAWMRRGGAWTRLSDKITRWWSADRVADFLAAKRRRPILTSPQAADLLATLGRRSDAETAFTEAGLLQLAQQCRDRQFTVLGVEAPRDEAWPWHEDWRYGYRWPPRYFRNYDFYRKDRPAPADVKLPWELSRLGFLIAVVQAEAISPQGRWMDAALAVVLDWERQNPLAFSVAWHPMEAAMRGLNLAMLLDMSISLDAAPVPLVRCCGC